MVNTTRPCFFDNYQRAMPGFTTSSVTPTIGRGVVRSRGQLLHRVQPVPLPDLRDGPTSSTRVWMKVDVRCRNAPSPGHPPQRDRHLARGQEHPVFVYPDARGRPRPSRTASTASRLTVYNWVNVAASQTTPISRTDGFVYRDIAGNPLGTARAERQVQRRDAGARQALLHRWQGASRTCGRRWRARSTHRLEHYGQSTLFETSTNALSTRTGRRERQTHRVERCTAPGRSQDRVSLAVLPLPQWATWTPFQRSAPPMIRWPGFAGGAVRRGSSRSATGGSTAESYLDLRLEEDLQIGQGTDRISIYADIQTCSTRAAITAVQGRYRASRSRYDQVRRDG